MRTVANVMDQNVLKALIQQFVQTVMARVKLKGPSKAYLDNLFRLAPATRAGDPDRLSKTRAPVAEDQDKKDVTEH